MFAAILLSLREGLEAALVIGIALGALRKVNRSELAPAVWLGAAAAGLLSLLGAVLLNVLGAEFEGQGEMIFEGFAMLTAAGLLTWMIFWMRRQSRAHQQHIELGARQAALTGGRQALFLLAFFAVLREGIELALFLLAARLGGNPLQTVGGALAGLGAAALLGWLLFSGTRRLNLKTFFQVTNVLLLLFAAGLAARGVGEFVEAGWLPALLPHVYDLNPLVNQESGVGAVLRALFGYTGSPSLAEMIAYLGYFIVLSFALRPTRNQLTVNSSQSTGI